jgi:NADH-quinone oxidoreductase subunit N
MLVQDGFGDFVRLLLVFFLVLLTLLILLTKIPGRKDATDFFVLVFGAAVGMCVMATANHLLTVFLGVEMAGVPCYVLAGFRRHERRGSEAALKYAVYGAAAAGVMLFGISLVGGMLGTFRLDPSSLVPLPLAIVRQPVGVASLTVQVPNDPNLVGTTFYTQALIIEQPGGSGLSNLTADVTLR